MGERKRTRLRLVARARLWGHDFGLGTLDSKILAALDALAFAADSAAAHVRKLADDRLTGAEERVAGRKAAHAWHHLASVLRSADRKIRRDRGESD